MGDDAAQLRLDFVRGRADGVDGAHPFAQQRRKRRVVGALVFAAENQVNAAGKRRNRFGGGVDVGGLRVVVELDAVDGGNKFQAMLDSLKILDGAGDRRRAGHAGQPRCADRSQHILHVVLAFERNLADSGRMRLDIAARAAER